VIDRFLGRMFRAGGPDYPFRAACAVLLIGHFVVALGVLLLAIQFRFNEQEFLTALVLGETTMLLGNLISAWRLRRALTGVRAVLAGEVTDEASLRRAWSSLVALPTRHFKLALQRISALLGLPLALNFANSSNYEPPLDCVDWVAGSSAAANAWFAAVLAVTATAPVALTGLRSSEARTCAPLPTLLVETETPTATPVVRSGNGCSATASVAVSR
jgi:hypothetical protein